MEGEFIQNSGGVGPLCPAGKLHRAINFVQSFVVEGLRFGVGLVVQASDESATLGPQGLSPSS